MDCRAPIEISRLTAAQDELCALALALGRSVDPPAAGIASTIAERLGLGDRATIGAIDRHRRPPMLDFHCRLPDGDVGPVSFDELLIRGAVDRNETLVAGVDMAGHPLLLRLPLAQPGVVLAEAGKDYLRISARAATARRLPDDGLVADLTELFGAYEQLGTLMAMYRACSDYVRGRVAGNWRLDAVPSVRERIADTYLSLLMLRAALDEAAAAFRSDSVERGRRMALARLAWFDHAPGCAATCLELHGGIVAVSGHVLQRLHRRLDDGTRLTRSAIYWRERLEHG